MFFETYRGTFSLNESVEILKMNKNHSPLYENGLRDLSRTFSLNESDECLQFTFKPAILTLMFLLLSYMPSFGEKD